MKPNFKNIDIKNITATNVAPTVESTWLTPELIPVKPFYTKEDIAEIRKNVDIPIIGIVKRDYPDCKVYITPTMKEIEELMEVKPEIIAMDATISKRPGGKTLDEFFK